MMYRVNEVNVSLEEDSAKDFLSVLSCRFNVEKSKINSYKIKKRSLDARKKSNIHYTYNFDVEFDKSVEQKIAGKFNLSKTKINKTEPVILTKERKVVVVGSGPAGLFSALELVKSNIKVILLERGESIDARVKTVNDLLKAGKLNCESNIQFGEGGAGTFSDGKLNTGINSPLVNDVLETFYLCGADENVLYDSKPHIGTDKLRDVVKNIRNKIIEKGGVVKFSSKFIDFEKVDGKISVKYIENGSEQNIICDDLILALGYSARDTLRHIFSRGVEFDQKAFSVGYRIEHLQEDINKSQYGEYYSRLLPPADYKLFTHLPNGRTVYTFCMCPGGEVVPAINNEEEIVTNGMSYHSRGGKNANSAILVSVSPEDYKSDHPLAGMEFQENLEKEAYRKSGGNFVVSRLEDFMRNRSTTVLGKVSPTIKPRYCLGNVYNLLPKVLSESIKEGVKELGKKLKGFDDKDALLTGIETRSSAPFLIKRQESMETSVSHIYAIGEGAGMAGGIVSSAVDGVKIARRIICKYKEQEL